MDITEIVEEMKNDIYDNMLSAYDLSTEQQKRNVIFEVNQQVILAGLYNGGFFDVAAFYGDSCLRIFHGLQRFSEDMDFSLLVPDDKFDFTKYFQPIIDEFAIVGREVEIKKKKSFGKVESAFLKDNQLNINLNQGRNFSNFRIFHFMVKPEDTKVKIEKMDF